MINKLKPWCTARQMGFADPDECPQLCNLAYDYLKKSKGCDENMYEYFSSQPDADSLYIKLVEELDRCTLSYFGFHWTQASLMINQVHTCIFKTKRDGASISFCCLRKELI